MSALLLLDSRNQDLERVRYDLWLAEVALQTRIEAAANAATAKAETPVEEPTIKFDKQPLYMSEEQEDVQWQLDNDLISTKAAEALLRELEFENAEVHLEEDYTYENFHTT